MGKKNYLVTVLAAILFLIIGTVGGYWISNNQENDSTVNNNQENNDNNIDDNKPSQNDELKDLKKVLNSYIKNNGASLKPENETKEDLMLAFEKLYFSYFPTNGDPAILSYDSSKLNDLKMSYIVWDYIYDSYYNRNYLIVEENETTIKMKVSDVNEYLFEIFNIKDYDVKDIGANDKSGYLLKKQDGYYVINRDIYFGMGNYHFDYNLRDIAFDSKFNQVIITFDITYHDAIDVLSNKKIATFNYDEKLDDFYLTKVEEK